ncbi:hypothetical protein ACIPUB_17355 [Paeniglutamicibacter sp. ORCA_105]|uniref:hypothetical protein n=1 Tax=Paeniglutamicibacter sp. ORCA_105 TaxID=3377336 RepID=UPI0038931D92
MNPAAILALLSEMQEEIALLRQQNTELAKAAEEAEAMRERIATLETDAATKIDAPA